MKVLDEHAAVSAQVASTISPVSAIGQLSVTERTASLRTYMLVACTAAATLGLELIQTRVLSFLYYNHVVYLTVTIALLGFGISGVFVSLFGSQYEHPERAISLLAAGFAISSYACLSLVSRIPEHLRYVPTACFINRFSLTSATYV